MRVILPILLSIFLSISTFTYAEGEFILPIDDNIYRISEEIFLTRHRIPPFEDLPLAFKELTSKSIDKTFLNFSRTKSALFTVSSRFFTPVLEAGICAYYNTEDRIHIIQKNDVLYDFSHFYDLKKIPSLLKAGFILHHENWGFLFLPEMRVTYSALFDESNFLNIPKRFVDLDTNIPYRAGLLYLNDHVEFRLMRDRIQLGPGRWSSLTVNKNIPYFDFLKIRLFFDFIEVSNYVIRLNPIIKSAESDAFEEQGQEILDFTLNGERIDPVKAKHLAINKLSLTFQPWFRLSFADLNLIGGRVPQIVDILPGNIFHNNYVEGWTNSSLSITTSLMPFKGIFLYGEFFLDDIDTSGSGNEIPNYKPTAFAYQFGVTGISSPFISLFSTRLRLDFEYAYVNPWCYHRWYNLWKYTSRFVLVDPGAGTRYWVDFPLGFYLGPDVIDLHFAVSYGNPDKWEIQFLYGRNGIGSTNDLTGWGDANLYFNIDDDANAFQSPSNRYGPVQWTQNIECKVSYYVTQYFYGLLWYRHREVTNRYHIQGNDKVFHELEASILIKLF